MCFETAMFNITITKQLFFKYLLHLLVTSCIIIADGTDQDSLTFIIVLLLTKWIQLDLGTRLTIG